jgi:predicted transcriptional regulator
MPPDKRDEHLALAPGTLRAEVLDTLWTFGQTSIRDLVDRLGEKRHTALPYSTGASALDSLCDLGFATRVRMPGKREYLYSAVVSREQLERAATIAAVQTLLAETHTSREALSGILATVEKAGSHLLDDLSSVLKQKRKKLKTQAP